MSTTAFLKIQLEDYEPMVASVNDEQFSETLLNQTNLGLDDLRILTLLNPVFPTNGSLGSLLPYPLLDLDNVGRNVVAIYGTVFDEESVPELSGNPPTVGCFSDYYVRYFISKTIAAQYPEMGVDIMNSTDEELESLVSELTNGEIGNALHFISKTCSLKILRCTPEDFIGDIGGLPLEPVSTAALIESASESEYENIDIFDIVKSRLVNENADLDEKGYSVAEYVGSGDYIQLWSDAVLSPNPNFGEPYVPIQCTPTSIEFLPNVVATPEKNKVTLRVSIKVDGRNIFWNSNSGGNYVDISFTLSDYNSEDNTPQGVADDIFLYSGIDLMRQYNARNWFTYSPYSTDQEENVPITISGRERGVPNTLYEEYRDVDCVMTFMLIDNLEPNQIDFTKEQWGEEVKVYSCSEFRNTAQ